MRFSSPTFTALKTLLAILGLTLVGSLASEYGSSSTLSTLAYDDNLHVAEEEGFAVISSYTPEGGSLPTVRSLAFAINSVVPSDFFPETVMMNHVTFNHGINDTWWTHCSFSYSSSPFPSMTWAKYMRDKGSLSMGASGPQYVPTLGPVFTSASCRSESPTDSVGDVGDLVSIDVVFVGSNSGSYYTARYSARIVESFDFSHARPALLYSIREPGIPIIFDDVRFTSDDMRVGRLSDRGDDHQTDVARVRAVSLLTNHLGLTLLVGHTLDVRVAGLSGCGSVDGECTVTNNCGAAYATPPECYEDDGSEIAGWRCAFSLASPRLPVYSGCTVSLTIKDISVRPGAGENEGFLSATAVANVANTGLSSVIIGHLSATFESFFLNLPLCEQISFSDVCDDAGHVYIRFFSNGGPTPATYSVEVPITINAGGLWFDWSLRHVTTNRTASGELIFPTLAKDYIAEGGDISVYASESNPTTSVYELSFEVTQRITVPEGVAGHANRVEIIFPFGAPEVSECTVAHASEKTSDWPLSSNDTSVAEGPTYAFSTPIDVTKLRYIFVRCTFASTAPSQLTTVAAPELSYCGFLIGSLVLFQVPQARIAEAVPEATVAALATPISNAYRDSIEQELSGDPEEGFQFVTAVGTPPQPLEVAVLFTASPALAAFITPAMRGRIANITNAPVSISTKYLGPPGERVHAPFSGGFTLDCVGGQPSVCVIPPADDRVAAVAASPLACLATRSPFRDSGCRPQYTSAGLTMITPPSFAPVLTTIEITAASTESYNWFVARGYSAVVTLPVGVSAVGSITCHEVSQAPVVCTAVADDNTIIVTVPARLFRVRLSFNATGEVVPPVSGLSLDIVGNDGSGSYLGTSEVSVIVPPYHGFNVYHADSAFAVDLVAATDALYVSAAMDSSNGFLDPSNASFRVYTAQGPVQCSHAVIVSEGLESAVLPSVAAEGTSQGIFSLATDSAPAKALPVFTLECAAVPASSAIFVDVFVSGVRLSLRRDISVASAANFADFEGACFRKPLTTVSRQLDSAVYRALFDASRVESKKLFGALVSDDDVPLVCPTHHGAGVARACAPTDDYSGRRGLATAAVRFLVRTAASVYVPSVVAAVAAAAYSDDSVTIQASPAPSIATVAPSDWDYKCATGADSAVYSRDSCFADGCSTQFFTVPKCLFGSLAVHDLECTGVRSKPVAIPTDCDAAVSNVGITAVASEDDTVTIRVRAVPANAAEFALTRKIVLTVTLSSGEALITGDVAAKFLGADGEWADAPSAVVSAETATVSLHLDASPLAEHSITVPVKQGSAATVRLAVLSGARSVTADDTPVYDSSELTSTASAYVAEGAAEAVVFVPSANAPAASPRVIIVLAGDWGAASTCSSAAAPTADAVPAALFPAAWLSSTAPLTASDSTVIAAQTPGSAATIMLHCTGELASAPEQAVVAVGFASAVPNDDLIYGLSVPQAAAVLPATKPIAAVHVTTEQSAAELAATVRAFVPSWLSSRMNVAAVDVDGEKAFAIRLASLATGLLLPSPKVLAAALASASVPVELLTSGHIDDATHGSVYSPFNEGVWLCSSAEGNFESCVVPNSCSASFQSSPRCVVADDDMNHSDDSFTGAVSCSFATPTPALPDWSGCGSFLCRSGAALVPCDSASVCVEGCAISVELTPEVISSSPALHPVCAKDGAEVDASLCPSAGVAGPVYAPTCRAVSTCCTDSMGNDCTPLDVAVVAAADGSGDYSVTWTVPPSASSDTAYVALTVADEPALGGGLTIPLSTVAAPGAALRFNPITVGAVAGNYTATVVYAAAGREGESDLFTLLPGCAGDVVCLNGGQCDDITGVCECEGEWSGLGCEVSPCEKKGCNLYGSTCVVSDAGEASCKCFTDEATGVELFFGPLCLTPTSGCADELPTCAHGGVRSGAFDVTGAAVCTDCVCEGAWTPISNCVQCGQACYNGGAADNACTSCQCLPDGGYHGEHCTCRHMYLSFIVVNDNLPFLSASQDASERARLMGLFSASLAYDLAFANNASDVKPYSEPVEGVGYDGVRYHTFSFRVGPQCGDERGRVSDSKMLRTYAGVDALKRFITERAHLRLPALNLAHEEYGFGARDPNCQLGDQCPTGFRYRGIYPGNSGGAEGGENGSGGEGTEQPAAPGSSDLSTGAIIGIAVGGSAFLAIIITVAMWTMGAGCFAAKGSSADAAAAV